MKKKWNYLLMRCCKINKTLSQSEVTFADAPISPEFLKSIT